ncbi:MAG: DUF58 domain-containing protein [Gammaproteobacteria bacterium]|nr:DUF58 domain-containing protein [Gammaproteobacteria bacterium]
MVNFKIRSWIARRSLQWMARRIPAANKADLNRRNIFILPTGNGVMFVSAAAVIFLAAINYEISLAFGLAFLMVSIFVVTMLYTFNNLNGLVITRLPTTPVFCGEDAGFAVLLSRKTSRTHESLELNLLDSTTIRTDLVAHDQEKVSVFARTGKRGEFKAPRLRISTCFPLGLFRAWSVLDMNLCCLVYPKPITASLSQIANWSPGSGTAMINGDGADDFYGLRSYIPGDSLKQVSWKNVARGQGMLTKQFVNYNDDHLWLDWDMYYGFGTEERLSKLCFCVLKLSAADTSFGLKLPGIEIKPSTGTKHRSQVLAALARYNLAPSAGMNSKQESVE